MGDKKKGNHQNSSLDSAFSLKMVVSGNPRELSLIRRILHASALSSVTSPGHLNDIKLAVTEACTNIIKHAFKFDTQKTYQISLNVTKEKFTVILNYVDASFYPDKIPVPNFQTVPEGGMGVFIIRNVMDEVEYTKEEESGAIQLRMVKFLSGAKKKELEK